MCNYSYTYIRMFVCTSFHQHKLIFITMLGEKAKVCTKGTWRSLFSYCIYSTAEQFNHWPTYIDFRPNTPCSLAWLVAGPNMLGGGSLWYWRDCDTICPVLLGAVHSHVPARPAARHIFSYRKSICSCLTGVLLWPPQKATLDSLCTLSCFVSYCLPTKFQHSLSAVTLGIYLTEFHLLYLLTFG